jgi:5-methylcytosine-specific restriction endonuclease McrA
MKNAGVIQAHCRLRRAREKGAAGNHTANDILFLLEKQRYKCANCSKSVRKMRHVDHIMPLAKGGSNDRKNLQILCPPCNLSKRAKHPIDWARENGRLL